MLRSQSERNENKKREIVIRRPDYFKCHMIFYRHKHTSSMNIIEAHTSCPPT